MSPDHLKVPLVIMCYSRQKAAVECPGIQVKRCHAIVPSSQVNFVECCQVKFDASAYFECDGDSMNGFFVRSDREGERREERRCNFLSCIAVHSLDYCTDALVYSTC